MGIIVGSIAHGANCPCDCRSRLSRFCRSYVFQRTNSVELFIAMIIEILSFIQSLSSSHVRSYSSVCLRYKIVIREPILFMRSMIVVLRQLFYSRKLGKSVDRSTNLLIKLFGSLFGSAHRAYLAAG